MALLFCDSFDHYATADITRKWVSAGVNVSISAAGGRRSGGALSVTSSFPTTTVVFAATSSFVVGFAFKPSAYATNGQLVQLLDAGTVQCTLFLNPDGTLSVFRSTSTAVTGGTSAVAIPTGIWSYIEFKVTISDSIAANSCKVRLNNVDIITVATGQDLKATANSTANSFALTPSVALSTATFMYDDLYLCDQTGSAPLNDFLGDVRVDALYPTSDGNYTDFTPSTGTSHFALVDENPPNTSDYNGSTTAGNRDSYGMGNLTALVSQTVYAVQANLAALKADAGAKSMASFVRSSGTNSDGATFGVGTDLLYIRQVFPLDPNGSIAWTESSVNAAELGALIVA